VGVVGSDGESEFGECGGELMSGIGVDAEFVVAAAEIWTKACPVLITRAEWNLVSPRIGRSRDFNRP
jgi:hypothetical protein